MMHEAQIFFHCGQLKAAAAAGDVCTEALSFLQNEKDC